MIISLIVAMDEQRGIGHHGGLPWRLSTDQKRFKAITMGHHLIMGRKTFETIGRPLPGRTIIILTRNPAYHVDGCLVEKTLDDALKVAKDHGETEVFVIGGGEIYAEAISLANRIYLTMVHAQVPADVFFPKLEIQKWKEVHSEYIPASPKDSSPTTFSILERL